MPTGLRVRHSCSLTMNLGGGHRLSAFGHREGLLPWRCGAGIPQSCPLPWREPRRLAPRLTAESLWLEHLSQVLVG